ncbi:MAG: B12-binding domain-containing radical SAM protein, partial [Firmicutes bacterium]|nr:B12-binding domain-containing radical SAM protein [Bacillota bacterium]
MKILLAAINAKYIHTSLSVRTLKAYAMPYDVEFSEYTINERAEDILRSIYRKKAGAVLFSCYIWNIGMCLDVADMLKKVSPETKIIFGGPEVSFDDTEYMERYGFIDGIMRGEGEATFREWLEKGGDIKAMTYRKNGEIIRNADREMIRDITSIPFPYTDEDIERNKGKLIYYESSRGCPFRCSYCLSSTTHSVRFRDMDAVKEELMFFIKHGVRIVKFVDRTFNADRKRAAELIKFLTDNARNTTFHFEVAADLITEEMTELFKAAPDGLFQLEIGVQSTNNDTIRAIDRKTDFEKIKHAVGLVKQAGGVHMHLDLIAGLPFEDIKSFRKSFDDVFALRPHVLQLGFLKLLRGTKIRGEENKYGYVYSSKPPYEVLKNDFMSYDDILRLKGIEEVFERYYNSGVFENSMEYLLKKYASPFDFFDDLRGFYSENGYDAAGRSRNSLYEILSKFCGDEVFKDILKLDYFINNKGADTPKWSLTEYNRGLLKERFEILGDEFIRENLREYENL